VHRDMGCIVRPHLGAGERYLVCDLHGAIKLGHARCVIMYKHDLSVRCMRALYSKLYVED
jgi:hypothetical protein